MIHSWKRGSYSKNDVKQNGLCIIMTKLFLEQNILLPEDHFEGAESYKSGMRI